MNYYRPGIGWFPKKPKSRKKDWTDERLLDWSTGKVIPAAPLRLYNASVKRGNKIAIDGLRTKSLKSSEDRKYHVGGPYNGAKLRKWIKKKSGTKVEILVDKYEIPGYNGHYQFDSDKDQYIWLTLL